WDGWAKIDHFACCFVDEEQVFVRMGLLFAAVVLLLSGRVGGPLTASLGAINGHIGCTFPCQGAVGDLARVALRSLSHIPQGLVQHGPQTMQPRVGWRLTQVEL